MLNKIHELIERNWHISLFHGLNLLEPGEIKSFILDANKVIGDLLHSNEIKINDLGKEIIGRGLKKLNDKMQWEISWLTRKTSLGLRPIINPELVRFAEDAYISEWREFLKECLRICGEDLNSSENEKSEYHFSQGEQGKARLVILEILKQSTSSIDVVDTYLDETILELLEDISNGGSLQIRLVGKDVRASFKYVYVPNKNRYPHLTAITSASVHDRYIIIDHDIIWHLGSSLKDIGKSVGSITKKENDPDKTKILNDFENLWNTGDSI